LRHIKGNDDWWIWTTVIREIVGRGNADPYVALLRVGNDFYAAGDTILISATVIK